MAHPVGRRQRIRTLARIAAWQLRSRLGTGEVEHRWLADSRLLVRRGMTGATGNIYFGLHEFADMGFVVHLLRPGDLFADIGANVGSFTVLAAKVAGSNVVAFEPEAQTAAILDRNIALNAIADRVATHRVALGDSDSDLWFTSGLDTENHVVAEAGCDTVRVRGTTLDKVLGGRVPLLMKIDVEGHEPAVIAGAAETLARPELRAIEIETVGNDIAALLRGHGFVRRHYDPFTRRLSASAVHAANNSLYVRDEAYIQQRLQTAPAIDIHGLAV